MALPLLIPIASFKFGFTTCVSIEDVKLSKVALADKALGVHKVTSNTTHNLVKPPSPSDSSSSQLKNISPPDLAWEAFYPKGSINPSAAIPGGFGFYLSGPSTFAQALENGATEVVMSYRMMLQDDWEWVKGGKLPGVFGGVGNLSYGCTGGRQDQRCQCFDLRPMWRPKSAGELYTYLPLTNDNEACLLSVPPLSTKNSDYGFSVGRGSFHFDKAVGQWISAAFRIKLNDIGVENGEIQLWIDGVSTMSIKGVTLRCSEEGKIKGMHFQTFFGGHSDDWASPKDQRAWFADVTGAVVQ